MKKLSLILITILCVAFCSCAAPNGGNDAPQGAGDVAYSKLTTEGLNNLREVVGDEWGYAFVAGDCIFIDDGYYKFEDVLEYTLGRDGVVLGEKDERDVFFTRDESEVRGVYRTQYNDGISTFYAFSAKYENPVVNYSYLGEFGYEEAFIGQGEYDNRIKILLIGDTLIAYDYLNGYIVTTKNVGANLQYDFNYFQKDNSAVIFTLDGNTEIYTFIPNYPESRFEKVSISGDYSLASNPAVIDGVYVFGGDDITCVSLDEKEFDEEQITADYTAYLEKLNDKTLSNGTYEVWLENGNINMMTTADNAIEIITIADVIEGCEEVSACISKREGYSPEISVIKQLDQESMYIVIEKEPDAFAGFRDVNDGIPPIIIKYNLQNKTFEFCGLVDFTGYSVYRIVKLV